MVAGRKPWPLVIAVALCTLVCMGMVVDAYPRKPEPPPANATAAEMAKFYVAVRRYLNCLSRQRYGKRSNLEACDVEP